MTGLLFQTLKENHKRAIAITLALLDESMCQFEEWACNREIRSILYHEVNTLSSDQQEKIRSEVSEMRAILLELRDTLRVGSQASSCGKYNPLSLSRSLGLSDGISEQLFERLRRTPDGIGRVFGPKNSTTYTTYYSTYRHCRGKIIPSSSS